MRRVLLSIVFTLAVSAAAARNIGLGLDAFNRSLPVSVTSAAVFSPLSFEIDSVVFAEAVDPIRRAIFAAALNVADEFEPEYRPLVRAPLENPPTNGLRQVWAHAFTVADPRKIDPSFRLTVQDLYAVEVCHAENRWGIGAWVRARFSGDFDDWRLPQQSSSAGYDYHDLVSVAACSVPTNGLKRARPSMTVYRLPLVGGTIFYALVPRGGCSVSSIRSKLTSVTLSDFLTMTASVAEPPVPVRLALPEIAVVSTNDLRGAFSYFRFPTAGLKPFPAELRPNALVQTMRFRLETRGADPAAERIEGPFLYFIHDPVAETLPVVGIFPGKDQES